MSEKPDISPEISTLYFQRAHAWVDKIMDEFCDPWGLENALVNLCQSEIERRFLVELLFADWGIAEGFRVREVDIHDPTMPGEPRENAAIVLVPQAPLLGYSIDIAILVRRYGDDAILKIAVECDGHDFHERTKEQAEHDKKRDRAMQKAGYYVFRFTGSEIFRKGAERALEVSAFVRQWRAFHYMKAIERLAAKAMAPK